MNKIAILRDDFFNHFEGDQYIVDFYRSFGGYQEGDLICSVQPFCLGRLPLTLELAIRADGTLVFRSWECSQNANNYLHTHEISEAEAASDNNPLSRKPFVPTSEQIDTVNGLFSGRILFEGLKIAVGASVLRICPIDLEREERLCGKKIYLA